jgi:hypothetical protein
LLTVTSTSRQVKGTRLLVYLKFIASLVFFLKTPRFNPS